MPWNSSAVWTAGAGGNSPARPRQIVQELLHPFALFFGLVRPGLCIPQRANVLRDFPPGRQGHRFASQLLADLVEQPRTANHTPADHQAAGARPRQQLLRLARGMDVYHWQSPGTACVDGLADAVVVHGQPVHLRDRAAMDGQRIQRVAGKNSSRASNSSTVAKPSRVFTVNLT